jgi:hypothetical protein
MGDYGLKVSKLASSIATTTLDRDLQFTSKYSGLKIYQAGTLSVAKTGTATVYGTVSHNLGFEPAHFVWRKFTASNSNFGTTTYPNAYAPIGAPNIWTPESDDDEEINCYTNSSDLVIEVNTGTALGTYEFSYYLLVDLANDYSGTVAGITTDDYGFKVSKPGIDVLEAKEYELVYSSKYKALQYYDVNFATSSITLPNQFSDPLDVDTEAGCYVDFYHGHDYPPFFLAFWKTNSALAVSTTETIELPYYEWIDEYKSANVSASCFATDEFIRLSFYRETHTHPFTAYGSLATETITFKLYVMTQDLSSGTI